MGNDKKKYPEPIVRALIINNEGKILLRSEKKWSGKYTCLSGHVELGETLEEAVLREVKEKTGLDVKTVDKLLFQDSVFEKDFHEKKHFIFIDFICKYEGGSELLKTNEEFEDEFKWYKIDEALKLNLTVSTKNLIKSYINYLESKNTLDSWKRCQADFENYKKDQAKHQEEFLKFAKMDVIEQILPVLDNFEASLKYVPKKENDSAWVTGIMHIQRQIKDILKNNGVEEIPVKVGDKFDPTFHEALGGKGEEIKKILQKGYKLNGRVLRAARVETQ
mgnify:CR=1 FL=1